jgi:hypothetical protein
MMLADFMPVRQKCTNGDGLNIETEAIIQMFNKVAYFGGVQKKLGFLLFKSGST